MPSAITGMAVSAGLTEALGLTGKLSLSLDHTLVPTIQVGNLESALWGPRAVGNIIVPAALALRSEIELSIPQQISGVGAAVIIDTIQFSAGANVTVEIGRSPGLPAPTVFGDKDWLDIGAQGLPVLAINGKDDAVATVGLVRLVRVRALAATTFTLPLGWVLREFPATGLQQGLLIRPSVDNQSLILNVFWRERLPR